MKHLLFFLLLSSLPASLWAQSADLAPTPHAYHFQSISVWAKISVLVIDQNGKFQLECQGDNPLEGWVLTHRPDNKIVSNNQENETDNFKLSIANPFDDYELTVFVNGQSEQIPMILDLAPDKNSAYTLPLYTPFEENPNRPFNTLVKSLYDQAGQAYIQGNNDNAIYLLEKALKVDPTEPQVLVFLNKLKPTGISTVSEKYITDTLIKAKKAEDENNFHEAKELYTEILKADPSNDQATKGMDRINANLLKDASKLMDGYIQNGETKKAQALLSKIKKIYPHDDRIKGWEEKVAQLPNSDSTTDRKAKADEAYNLGLESYRKDDFASAKKFWEETLQIDPHYIQAQQNLNRLTQDHPGLQ